MSALTVTVAGKRVGRSTLAMAAQDWLRAVEADVQRLEDQLWQLMEARPECKASYCAQWRAMTARMEREAFERTGLQVAIETPSWVLLSESKMETSAQPTKGQP